MNQRLLISEGDSSAENPETAGGAAPADRRERITEFWDHYREATALRVRGSAPLAMAAYRRALALNNRHEDALYYLGSMEFALGRFAEAEQTWRRLVQVNPASARAHSQLGGLYLCLDQGAPFDPERAVAELRRAHQINKEETGPILRLGEAALFQGDFRTAGHQFDAVLGANTGSGPAHFYRGYAAWKNGEADFAAKAFARSVAASVPPKPVLPEGATSEGDTRGQATPRSSEPERCAALRRLLSGLGEVKPSELRREMAARYRALDGLIARSRRSSH